MHVSGVGWGIHKLTELQRHPQILTCDEIVDRENKKGLPQYSSHNAKYFDFLLLVFALFDMQENLN